jgi:hypothetical protein
VAQVEAVRLNKEKMALVIQRFKAALKGHKEYIPTRTNQRESGPASNVVISIILLHNVVIMKMTRDKKRNVRRKRRTTGRRRARRTLTRNGTPTVLHPTPTMKD